MSTSLVAVLTQESDIRQLLSKNLQKEKFLPGAPKLTTLPQLTTRPQATTLEHLTECHSQCAHLNRLLSSSLLSSGITHDLHTLPRPIQLSSRRLGSTSNCHHLT